MTEKNEKFPNALGAVALLLGLMFLEFLLGAAVHDMGNGLGLNRVDAWGMVTLIANGLIFTAVMEYKGMTYRELFHSAAGNTRDWQVVLAAVLMTVPALIGVISYLVDFVAYLFPLSSAQKEMFQEMSSGTVGSIVLACLLAPVLEEMLFRGVILRSFLIQYAKWPAIVASAVIFGVAHMNLYQFFVGLVLGTFLGWLYQRTRSLVPCIVLHMAYNGTLTVLELRGIRVEISDADFIALIVLMVYLGAQGVMLLRRTLPSAAP